MMIRIPLENRALRDGSIKIDLRIGENVHSFNMMARAVEGIQPYQTRADVGSHLRDSRTGALESPASGHPLE